jgi:biopolymer transport protein ExbD
MARAAAAVRTFEAPLGEMNTTPLIDVMLVLLVMLILAVPAAVNEVPIDLPAVGQPDWPIVEHKRNLISITADSQVQWNAQPVTQSQLAALLLTAHRLNPEPELQFEPSADAPYDTTAKVLNVVKQSGVSAFGFIGNDRYTSFGKPKAAR